MMLNTTDENFGLAISEIAGLAAAASSIAVRLGNGSFGVARVTSTTEGLTRTAALPFEPAYLVSLHLRSIRSRRLWMAGRICETRPVEAGTATVIDLEQHSTIEVDGPFDALALYVPHRAITRLLDERGSDRMNQRVAPSRLTADPILEHLARCFLPSLDEVGAFPRSGQVDSIVEDLAIAVQRHLAGRMFGGHLHTVHYKGGLAPWQERRAIEVLSSISASERSMPEVARACGLSASHFARAFRQSTGVSPHQWLLRHKVSRAKSMLVADHGPIAEIAVACGFSDQSHLNRVFARVTGISPGLWRRARLGSPSEAVATRAVDYTSMHSFQ